jgi:peptide/nickel transport system permease protein
MPFFAQRAFTSFLVILAVTVSTFVFVRLLPGDPAAAWVGEHPTQEQLEMAQKQLGLDQPIYVQGWRYIVNIFQGDWGTSIRTRQPVLDEVSKRFAATFELTSLAMLMCLVFGIPIGVLAARYPGHWLAKVEKFFSLSGVAIPIFWMGMLMQLFFSGWLDWLPLQGRRVLPLPDNSFSGILLFDSLLSGQFDNFADALQHIFMPALALSIASFGIITRSVRNAMGHALQQDYVRTAHAFGIAPSRILFVHALKNALIPIVTISGLVYGYLLGGTFLVERVFDWPGLGQLAVLSILTNDMPVVTAVALVYAFVYTVINLLLDLFYRWIDPRV